MDQLQADDGALLASRLEVATSLWARFLGLMGRRELPAGAGLWLRPCNQVHTFFCRFAMDVAFLDDEGRILHVVDAMRPWRVSRLVLRAKSTVELPAGTLRAAGVARGALLRRVAASTQEASVQVPEAS